MSASAQPHPSQQMISAKVRAEVAVALADEGVPVRAIARSIKTPGEDVYELLKQAVANGRLIELPKDDWPPGGRHNRTQIEKAVLHHDDSILRLAAANYFKFTKLQSVVFIALLRRSEASKAYLHNAVENNRASNAEPTDQKMIDVVICGIRRRMRPLNIEIETIWGVGYYMKPPSREAALGFLNAHLATTGV